MKLYIVYANYLEVKVENVKFVSVIDNTLYYLVGDELSARMVDLNTIATFSMIE